MMVFKYAGRISPFKMESIQSFINCKTMSDFFNAKYCYIDMDALFKRKSPLLDLIKKNDNFSGGAFYEIPKEYRKC